MSGLILEDCPFCGNHKAVCKESSVFSWVACLTCSAQGPACLTRPEARRAWNVASIKNRKLLDEVERLRGEVERLDCRAAVIEKERGELYMPTHQVLYCEDCVKPYCKICDPECPNCRENLPTITVCSKCRMACCWQGIFLCDDAVSASTVKMSRAQLRVLDLENSCYWLTDEELARL